MKNGTIEYLDSLKKGDFCTVNIPLINNVTIPITAMYMGKDEDNRYKFIDKGNFVLPAKLIEEKAIQVNIHIIDTFVKMRQWALENKELSERLTELERYFINHCNENN